MPKCKKCNSVSIAKSGRASNKQRYYCKECGCHFTEGDARTNETISAKKAMCVVLYSLGKVSFRTLAKIFHTSPSLTYRWVTDSGCKIPAQETGSTVRQMKLDETWEFIKDKTTVFDTSKAVTVAVGELGQKYSTIVILQYQDKPKIP